MGATLERQCDGGASRDGLAEVMLSEGSCGVWGDGLRKLCGGRCVGQDTIVQAS